jgi:multimeric flavodoxin WrbA
MKILVLNSSFRKQGNTAKAIDLLKESLETQANGSSIPVEIQIVNLAYLELQICRGCRTCFDRGEAFCPLKDDLLPLHQRILAADAVVLASPVYVSDVNAVMKNWIDRMAFLCHRPQYASKAVFLLTTTGSAPSSHALRTMDVAFHTWGGHTIGKLTLIAGARMMVEEMRAQYQVKLNKAAGKVLRAMQRKEQNSPSFLALMFFRIQQGFWRRHRDDSFDYRYWSSQGRLEKKRSYYTPHKSSPLITVLARLAGYVIGLFVT